MTRLARTLLTTGVVVAALGAVPALASGGASDGEDGAIVCTQTVANVFRDAAVDDDDVGSGSPTFTG